MEIGVIKLYLSDQAQSVFERLNVQIVEKQIAFVSSFALSSLIWILIVLATLANNPF